MGGTEVLTSVVDRAEIRGLHLRAGGGVSSTREVQGHERRGDALFGRARHIQKTAAWPFQKYFSGNPSGGKWL